MEYLSKRQRVGRWGGRWRDGLHEHRRCGRLPRGDSRRHLPVDISLTWNAEPNVRPEHCEAAHVVHGQRAWRPGFYYTHPGTITGFYDAATRQHNFKPWASLDSTKVARAQPAEIQDDLLHETAVAWVRSRLASTTPTVPWEETPEDFANRLQEAADFANADYDVSGLCRELNWRLEQLVKVTHGDRLKK